jgi:hypothetical protein
MTYKVTVSSGYNYNVKLKTSIEIMPQNLNDLTDVEISGNNNKYVLMYDSVTGKWRDVNPDEVLIASSTSETTQPGLPGDFINTLDVDLDNKIDLDAGEF